MLQQLYTLIKYHRYCESLTESMRLKIFTDSVSSHAQTLGRWSDWLWTKSVIVRVTFLLYCTAAFLWEESSSYPGIFSRTLHFAQSVWRSKLIIFPLFVEIGFRFFHFFVRSNLQFFYPSLDIVPQSAPCCQKLDSFLSILARSDTNFRHVWRLEINLFFFWDLFFHSFSRFFIKFFRVLWDRACFVFMSGEIGNQICIIFWDLTSIFFLVLWDCFMFHHSAAIGHLFPPLMRWDVSSIWDRTMNEWSPISERGDFPGRSQEWWKK